MQQLDAASHQAGAAAAVVSVGDEAPLNTSLGPALSEVWIDRDLSWLDFNERVLAEALDPRTPLLERAKFLAIFNSNLDEFFMKRIAVVREKLTRQRVELLEGLRERILPMLERQAECFRKEIVPGLAAHGVFLRRWHELTEAQQQELAEQFDSRISLALTPLVFEPTDRFPFLSNLSVSVAFRLYDSAEERSLLARIKVPSVLKQWVPVQADTSSGETVLVRLHEVIRENAHKLYGGMKLSRATLFRVTRDAEVPIDDDEHNPREAVKEQIRQRRFEPGVRLEFAPGADPEIREVVRERFGLLPMDVYDMPAELDYTSLFEVAGLNIAELRDPPWKPVPHPALLARTDIFSAIRAGDILVHHPYDSFGASVERFIDSAASDPKTVAVKMTVYRVGDDTPFVRSLIRAAEAGKQVACVIELQARFDEERNLYWAAELERAGAHVSFGVHGLKTHAKTALVVRDEVSGLRAYAHVGTGNYNARTAQLYTDVGLLTCDPLITRDVVSLFHHLTGRSARPDCRTLLAAPNTMRARFLELVEREVEHHRAGLPARIVAKMNQLEDPATIEALCNAALAGVPIDLIVRGFCCLRPGVPGISEGIRIRSVIGRFLEHSRIFHFANGKKNPVEGEFFIGSGDWMVRNLSHRIEIAAPILASAGKQRLWEILDACLRDRRQAWTLGSDGSYGQLRPADHGTGPEGAGTQQYLMDVALFRADRYSAQGEL